MTAATHYPHLTIGDDGAPRIGRTRYKIRHLAAEHYHYGWSAEELLRQHPDLRPEEVYAALTYFYDHFEELIEQMGAAAEQAESLRGPRQPTRAELLKRKPPQGP